MNKIQGLVGTELALGELEQVAGGRHRDCPPVQQTEQTDGFTASLSSPTRGVNINDYISKYVPKNFAGSISVHEGGIDFNFAGHLA